VSCVSVPLTRFCIMLGKNTVSGVLGKLTLLHQMSDGMLIVMTGRPHVRTGSRCSP